MWLVATVLESSLKSGKLEDEKNVTEEMKSAKSLALMQHVFSHRKIQNGKRDN